VQSKYNVKNAGYYDTSSGTVIFKPQIFRSWNSASLEITKHHEILSSDHKLLLKEIWIKYYISENTKCKRRANSGKTFFIKHGYYLLIQISCACVDDVAGYVAGHWLVYVLASVMWGMASSAVSNIIF
jgi:hypothetical protein